MSLVFSYWNLAEELRLCVCTALEAESLCGCPCRTCIIVGPAAADDCCEGQLWVSIDRVYPFGNFPKSASEAIICFAPLAVVLSVGILRCAPVIKEDGTPPTCDELSESAMNVYEDARIILEQGICCLQTKHRHRKFTVLDQTFLGPGGGCVGSLTKFAVELLD